MHNSFIHFRDLDLVNLDLYHYENNEQIASVSVKLDQLQQNLSDSVNCIVFLPSQLFGFHHFNNNAGLKNDELQANIIIEIEDSIISDISALNFFYDPGLNIATWINATLLTRINKQFNTLSGNFTILPEHLLLESDDPNILFDHRGFCISYGDGSGFSGEYSSFEQLYSSLVENKFAVERIHCFRDDKDTVIPEIFAETQAVKELRQFHLDFIKAEKSFEFNFFKREFSLEYFRSQMRITTKDLKLIAALCFVIFTAPLLTNYLLTSYSNSYTSKTIQIFKQLNPSFNKLVNSKAQIDELSKNLPDISEDSLSSEQELKLLSYIERLNDPSFKQIDIDLEKQIITIRIEDLSGLKLKIIQEALKQNSLLVDDSNLVEKNNSFFGGLIVKYNNG